MRTLVCGSELRDSRVGVIGREIVGKKDLDRLAFLA
jgi:hypothetical protein